MYYPVYFKIKNVGTDKVRLIELLFKDWIDNICENQVEYRISSREDDMCMSVQFMNVEDATAVKLKGLPVEFEQYIKIVD